MPILVRRHLPGVLMICLAGGLVAGFYLNLYRARGATMPLGYDTSRYLGQTALVAERGLAEALDVEYPPPSVPLGSQVGYPVLVLSLSKVLGASLPEAGAAVPAVALAALALAGGALVSFTLRRGAVELTAVALIVGASPPLVRLFLPEAYNDNIFAAALFIASLVPIISWVREGRGLLASALLLAVSGVAHPSFVPVELGILGLTWLYLLPASWRDWRSKEVPVSGLPAFRLAAAVACSLVIMAIFVFVVLGTSPRPPSLGREVFEPKLRADVPLYAFPVTVPLAAVGLFALAHRARRGDDGVRVTPLRPGSGQPRSFEPRMLLAIMIGWCAITALGLALFGLGGALPAHRLLAFCLPLPILGGLAVLAAGRLARSRIGLAGAGAILLAGIVGLGWIGYHDLYHVIPRTRGTQPITGERVREAATANAYLESAEVPVTRPVVFVISHRGRDVPSAVQLDAFVLRMQVSPQRVEHMFVYVGEPERYLAGEPTHVPNDRRGFNRASREYWPAVRRILPRGPIALVLDAYHTRFDELSTEHPEWLAAPGLLVLEGPRPPDAIALPAIQGAPGGVWALVGFGVGGLVVLGLVGLGWTIGLVRGARPFEILALSVSMGLGMLVVAGAVLDRVGLSLGGTGGTMTAALTAAAGAGVAWIRHRGAQGGIEEGADDDASS
jgi:hypothetical protein